MAEKTYTHHQHEQDKDVPELEDHAVEKLDELVEQKPDAEPVRELAEENSESEPGKDHAELLDEIRLETEVQAMPIEEITVGHIEKEEPEAAASLVSKDLRQMKYSRTLQSIRKDLSAPEKALSKIVHNPVVDAVSSAAEKTVARPSGLLFGGIFAFLGSSSFLYIAKHYGYEYNFLMFALFFAAGFGLGLILELIFRIFKKAPKA